MTNAPRRRVRMMSLAVGVLSGAGLLALTALEGRATTRAPTNFVSGFASKPDGTGYWEVFEAGGVVPFGSAKNIGDAGSLNLTAPVEAMASTPSGNGYWLAAADGGVFAFGDAGFFGSAASHRLSQPIDAIHATPTGKGYWLKAKDGGVFTFGDAVFFGSVPAQTRSVATP